jgi:hypothetical protein
MSIIGDRYLIAVNHSGRVEGGSAEDLSSHYTLSGLSSPRFFSLTGPDEFAVSDLQTSVISFFNIDSGNLTATVDIGRSSEAMIRSGNHLFVSNWSSYYVPGDNRYVMVVDIDTKELIDSVETGKEPQSMVRDYLGRIWVLCSGGFDGSEYPVLVCIDPVSLQVIHWLDFPSKDRSPSGLSVNGTLDTLYYLDKDVYRMSVNNPALPTQAFIPGGNNSFYALGIDPRRGDVFLSDALDYQQRGFVWRYDRSGQLIQKMRSGIIPGGFCFN